MFHDPTLTPEVMDLGSLPTSGLLELSVCLFQTSCRQTQMALLYPISL